MKKIFKLIFDLDKSSDNSSNVKILKINDEYIWEGNIGYKDDYYIFNSWFTYYIENNINGFFENKNLIIPQNNKNNFLDPFQYMLTLYEYFDKNKKEFKNINKLLLNNFQKLHYFIFEDYFSNISENVVKYFYKKVQKYDCFIKLFGESNIPLLFKKIEHLNDELEKQKNKIDQNEKKISELNEILKKEKILKDNTISIIIISNDENILFPLVCQKSDKFEDLEKKFYKKYPEYEDKGNIFYLNEKNEKIIIKNESLDKNNINNGDIIKFKNIK